MWFRATLVFFNLVEQAFIWMAYHHFDKIAGFVAHFGITNTNFLAITYQLSNFFWLGWFYALLMPGRYSQKVKVLAGFLFVITLINYLFIEGIQGFGIFNPAATALFTFGLAFFYLWYIYRSQLALPLNKNPYFWMSLGLILPYLVSLFLFVFGEPAQNENFTLFMTMTIMKDGFIIIAQILITIGFFRARYARFVPLPSTTLE